MKGGLEILEEKNCIFVGFSKMEYKIIIYIYYILQLCFTLHIDTVYVCVNQLQRT